MAVKKSVAAPAVGAIPETASTAGELEATPSVTATTQTGAAPTAAPSIVDAAAEKRNASLAKARATRAANLAARKAAKEREALTRSEISNIQAALAADAQADASSFGVIKEVAKVTPTAEEYVRVEIPASDLFDHGHPGVQLNRHKFEPGRTYMLRGDVALEVKRRLAMFHDEQVRLLRPNADRKALADVNRGSSWTSRGGNSITPLGRLEDVPVASDEKIYTVLDF